MKKVLLIGLSILLSNATFSQMSGDYSYSLAVRGYSLLRMPKILNQKNTDNFSEALFHGGIIKFNHNQISYRLGAGFIKKDLRIVNDCATCEEANGTMKDYSFSLGFEKSINFSQIQPYFAFDIGFRYNKFNGAMVSTHTLAANASSDLGPNEVETSKTGFTAAPIIGIKLNPIAQVTLFIESNLQWFYSYERQETIAADANTRTFNKYDKSEFLMNPVSIGIQLNLGNNR